MRCSTTGTGTWSGIRPRCACTGGRERCTRGRAARSTARKSTPGASARTPRITSAPTSRSRSPATCMRPVTSTTPDEWPGLSSVGRRMDRRRGWSAPIVATRSGTPSGRASITAGRQQCLHQHGRGQALREATAMCSPAREEAPPAWQRDRRRPGPARSARRAPDQPRRSPARRAQAGVPEGAAGIFPVGYRTTEAVETATYRYAVDRAGSAIRRHPDAQCVAARLRRPGREPDLARRAARSPATAITSTSRSWSLTSTRGSRTDRPRASPMFANIERLPDGAACTASRVFGSVPTSPTHGRGIPCGCRRAGAPFESGASGSAGDPGRSRLAPARAPAG